MGFNVLNKTSSMVFFFHKNCRGGRLTFHNGATSRIHTGLGMGSVVLLSNFNSGTVAAFLIFVGCHIERLWGTSKRNHLAPPFVRQTPVCRVHEILPPVDRYIVCQLRIILHSSEESDSAKAPLTNKSVSCQGDTRLLVLFSNFLSLLTKLEIYSVQTPKLSGHSVWTLKGHFPKKPSRKNT